MNIALPSRASDAGPQCKPDERTPEQLVSEAEEYLNLYWSCKRAALQADTRNKWLCHLRAAQRLLDLAEEREIG